MAPLSLVSTPPKLLLLPWSPAEATPGSPLGSQRLAQPIKAKMPTEPKVGGGAWGRPGTLWILAPGLGSLSLPGAQLSSSASGHWTCLPASWSLLAGFEGTMDVTSM